MTETRKTVKKASGKGRDAYDEFLEMTQEKPKKASSGKKAASGSGASAKKSGAAPKKKSVQVEPGIVALEGKRPEKSASPKKRASADGAEVKKPAPKRTASGIAAEEKSAVKKKTAAKDGAQAGKPAAGKKVAQGRVTVEENPVANRRSAAEKAASGKKAESSPKKPPRAAAGRSSGTPETAQPRKKAAGNGKPKPAGAAPERKKSAPRSRNAVLHVENSDGRDAYDEFLEASGEKKASVRKRRFSGVTAALVAAILCVLGLGVFQQVQYWEFSKMRAAVERQTFYEGTTVEGVDVSTMSLQQAQAYWAEEIEPKYAQRAVMLSNGAMFTSGELGYSSDYASVLANAWSAGRAGSLEERYAMISSRQMKPVEYTVTRRPYSEEGVQACVEAMAAQIDQPAEDAHIKSFNMDNFTFEFAEEKTGSRLDRDALSSGIKQAMEAGGGTVELAVETVQPRMKKADIAGEYGMITSAVTNASSSNRNRLTNIRLSLQLINGTCLKPGETFSFNETVGRRTSERGFKVATAYSGGEVTEEVGGGICQVSTTLFNAAVKADLEIVERHNHSLTVGYVDRGKDAAVNWNSQDLRFTNTTDDDLYICCILDDDKRVRVGIFGKLIENGEYITVEGVTTDTIAYETSYQLNFEMLPGTTRVLREGKNGYAASAYKIRWDASGKQISKELLCKSRYKAVNAIVEHGP